MLIIIRLNVIQQIDCEVINEMYMYEGLSGTQTF